MAARVETQLTAVVDSSRPGTDRVRLFINGVPDPLQHTMIGNLDRATAAGSWRSRRGSAPRAGAPHRHQRRTPR